MTKIRPADLYLVPWVKSMLARYADGKSLDIIDVGCGDGMAACQLASDHRIRAFDLSEEQIASARSRGCGVQFNVGSLYETDLAERMGPADCIISLEVVEHLYEPRKLFDFCRAALKPGGLLLLTTPYHGYWKNLGLSLMNGWDHHFHVDWDGGHVKFFSRRSLDAMTCESGLSPIHFAGIGRLPGLWKSLGMVARR